MRSLVTIKREPVKVHLLCQSRIKKWAFDNAYTLIFLAVMFFITWTVEVVIKFG
jgi:hypothetical protein